MKANKKLKMRIFLTGQELNILEDVLKNSYWVSTEAPMALTLLDKLQKKQRLYQ